MSRSSASKTPEFYSTRPALESNDQQMPSYNVRGALLPMCSPTPPVHPFGAAQYDGSSTTTPVSVYVPGAPSTQSVRDAHHTLSPPVASTTQSVRDAQHTLSPPVAPTTHSVERAQQVNTTARTTTSTPQPNTNPFCVKFIKENIRMC